MLVSTLVLALEIWRIYILWTSSVYQNPILIFVIVYAFGTIGFSFYVHIRHVWDGSKPVIASVVVVETSLTFMIFFLLGGRIIYLHWCLTTTLNGTQSYPSGDYKYIALMLIDSYALVAIAQLAELISIVAFNPRIPAVTALKDILPYTLTIAHLLALHRVLDNRKLDQLRSAEHQAISSLRWNRDTLSDIIEGEQDPAGAERI
ncbi:hypothetical protein NP233_g1975 [Leucocoprinus birnbaumii]|uniref:Uncharacterized protein n=1 Tax=Leucocoprinus birnbaumii TaxID=56174 RepID=A0AAD5W517_9AGAR|nr:hypothetical protein NP233_g1975 [Leucocoprinus birnbaumii]